LVPEPGIVTSTEEMPVNVVVVVGSAVVDSPSLGWGRVMMAVLLGNLVFPEIGLLGPGVLAEGMEISVGASLVDDGTTGGTSPPRRV
jgi:hypothetical protein